MNIDDENSKEDVEQGAVRGGEAVVDIGDRNHKEDGERARKTPSFGNIYKIPERQPTVCLKSQPFSYHLLGSKRDIDRKSCRISRVCKRYY